MARSQVIVAGDSHTGVWCVPCNAPVAVRVPLHLGDLGQSAAADLLIQAIGSGPAELVDGKQPHYSASAYGHSGPNSLPSLSVSLGVTYVPMPEDRGGIESDPDPADVR